MESNQEKALAYLKGELSAKDRKAFEEALLRSDELRAELESSRQLLDLLDAANDEATVRLVNNLLQQAIRERASDIHLTCEPSSNSKAGGEKLESVVSFRIDGKLYAKIRYPKERHPQIVDRFKVMAEMNLSEKRIPQDGRIAVRSDGKMYDLRVSVIPTITGERVTARVLDRETVLIGLEKLGMNAPQVAAIQRLLKRPYGFIFAAGITGSGKTTLLYSMLKEMVESSQDKRNILSIEDPVEYRLPGVSQIQVNRKAGMTFAAGLRSISRSDPEAVYIAQLRDLECAELATELALTGHLVLTQLHVSSALGIIPRLREMGITPFLVPYTLAGSVGLRLVRQVCPNCTEEYAPAPDELRKAGLSGAEDGPFRRGKGCAACSQTGFQGRIGLFEVLEVDDNLRRMLLADTPIETLWWESFGRRGGSLWDDARDKVRKGLTTIEEVNWALFDYPHPNTSLVAGQPPRFDLSLNLTP